MTETPGLTRCRNCGQGVTPPDEVDSSGWCEQCRRVVVRRATLAGRIVGGLGALGLAFWIFGSLQPGRRFLVVWLVLIAATHFVLYFLTRRVAFEIIRARGVPAPEE